MAGKTPTDLVAMIAEVREEVAVLATKTDMLTDEIGRAELAAVRERLAVLETQVADLRKRQDVDDGRRWQFWVGVGTVTLTFVANLTVNLLLYFARR